MRFAFLTAAILLALSIHAQITFDKGYFINNSGQKTDCYIENLDWKNNPITFVYKLQETDTETKTGNIAAIKEFGIDNTSQYKRFTVKVEYSEANLNRLSKTKNPEWQEKTCFLETLVSGNASLYSYTDGNVTKFFYEVNQKPIEQLVYIKYYLNSIDIGENNQFRQQLLNNVKCEKTSEHSIAGIDYDKRELIKHFIVYNSYNSATSINYEMKKERKVFSLKITPSINLVSLKVIDPKSQYNVSTDFKKTVFKFGIELEYTLPFNKNTWSIFTNPTYLKFDPTKHYEKNDGVSYNGQTINYIATVDYSCIEIPIGIRRYFF